MEEIREGYKKTKVGIVPNEWREVQLKRLLIEQSNSVVMDDNQKYELITVKRAFGGVITRGFLYGKDIKVKSQFYIDKNDFVISKRQIAHGACGLVPNSLEGAIVSNEYNIFKAKSELIDIVFFNYYVQKPNIKKKFLDYSDGIHIEKLLFKTKSWLKLKFPIPPLKEQTKIAKILSLWDEAIDKQSKLIEQKKLYKKGLMQKLLSGEMRFREFSGEWEIKKLTEICNKITSGGTPSRDKNEYYKNGQIKWIKTGELKNNFIYDSKEKITENAIKNSSAKLFPSNTILIAMYGATIGQTGYLKVESATNQACCAIICNQKFLKPLFIWKYFIFIKDKLIVSGAGAGQPNISQSIIKKISLPLPSLEEQTKIAETLNLVDIEIELLQKELHNFKLQKRGLMQKLLSGEIRVA